MAEHPSQCHQRHQPNGLNTETFCQQQPLHNTSPSFASDEKTVTSTPKKSRSVIRQRRVAGQLVCPKPGCGYRYNLRRELNRHMHTHAFATIDRYQCMTCRAGLCRLDSVKRHMEAKGKQACLAKGTYGEFNDRGELIRIRECKPSWYTSAAALRASEKA
ncbi:hypothetical protein BGW42_008541 [Actinomortierella wolfii]|nr:hypothetical protein BGW42_008541 [Actinomortierella wolfii]